MQPLARPRPLVRFSACLLAVVPALLDAVEDERPPTPAPDPASSAVWSLEAPHWNLTDYLRVVEARHGFVLATAEGWTLIGDALRWDLESGDLFAMGRIVLVIPGGRDPVTGVQGQALRLEADRIGLRYATETNADDTRTIAGGIRSGEAWNVQVFLGTGPRYRRLRCERATLTPERITFSGLAGDGGHGGFLGLATGELVVGLRDQPRPDRPGFERVVEDLTLWHPRLTLAGIPVLYLPVVYRDYRLDYPWTRYRFGDSDRQGPWLRAWIGSDLPRVAGWSPRLHGRVDRYQRVGTAFGARGLWRHPVHGAGEALSYAFDRETVRRDEHPVLERRSAKVVDLAQRLRWPGGAVYGRWTELPPADPGTGFDERFRADYLEEDLEHRPQARRGVAAVHSWPALSLSARVDRRATDQSNDADLLGGVGLSLPTLSLIGPLSVVATAEAERWEQPARDDSTDRMRFAAAVQADHWFAGGFGLAATGGIEGLAYEDPVRAGVELDDRLRTVRTLALTGRWQVVGRFDSLTHRLVGELGLEARGSGRGDDLPGFAFDGADRLAEDSRLLVVGLDTDVTADTTLMRARIDSRWAVRDQDLPAGREQAGDFGQRLSLATIELATEPTAAFSATIRGTWDGERRDWSAFDADLEWIPHPRVLLDATATWRVTEARWQYRPAITLVGGRYRLHSELVIDQDRRSEPRGFSLALTRRSVDGAFGVTYDLDRDEDGAILEQSLGITFSLDPFGL